jgi:hypothetical protein
VRAQRAGYVARAHLEHRDRHLGRVAAQRLDRLLEIDRAHRRRGADTDRAGQAVARLAGGGERRLSGGQRRTPGLEQRGARCGQAHVVGRALDELDAELALELAHGLRHRLLAYEQPLGRAGEAQLFGDGDERAQLAEVGHAATIGRGFTTDPRFRWRTCGPTMEP